MPINGTTMKLRRVRMVTGATDISHQPRSEVGGFPNPLYFIFLALDHVDTIEGVGGKVFGDGIPDASGGGHNL